MKKVLKILAFIIEQPSYTVFGWFMDSLILRVSCKINVKPFFTGHFSRSVISAVFCIGRQWCPEEVLFSITLLPKKVIS